MREGVAGVKVEVAPVEHGTLTAYTKRGCRCAACRENWNTYMRWWRVEQRGRVHTCPTCTCEKPSYPPALTAAPPGRGEDVAVGGGEDG